MNKVDSLVTLLADWFDKPLNELPSELRKRVEGSSYLDKWDSLSIGDRREAAKACDRENDPETRAQEHLFDCYVRIDEIEREIKKWESVACPTAQDLQTQKEQLSRLHTKRDEINEEIIKNANSRTGNRDRDLQLDANELAARWKEEGKLKFSKRQIVNALYKMDRWKREFDNEATMERRLRKKW